VVVASLASLIIVSMKVPIEEVEEPIVIKNRSQPTMQEVEKGASANKVKGTTLDSMYFQSRWCLSRLTP
jgi:hypothetical protein